MFERELTYPVSLTDARGRFNTEAHGWARANLVDASAIDGRSEWGRNKRWEYWCVCTPTHFLACTISSLDYLSLGEIFIHDRTTNRTFGRTRVAPGSRSVRLPGNLEGNVATLRIGSLRVTIEEVEGGTRVRADGGRISFDVVAERPRGHERLAVAVPWDDRRFQYTVKDVARPATGHVTVHGVRREVPAGESWAVLDHGRGRWPREITWNWGAGSGRLADGRVVGLQLGGKWTVDTGSTENAVLIGNRLHKISEELAWDYDPRDPMMPWRVRGAGLDATLTPEYPKRASTNLGVLSSRTDQVFGTWSGNFRLRGEELRFDGLPGFAEETHQLW